MNAVTGMDTPHYKKGNLFYGNSVYYILMAMCLAFRITVASSNGHKDVIELLIARGIEKNPRDLAGMTPLHIAVYNGHKEAVLLLIAKGANAGLKDYTGQTALHLGSWDGEKDIVDLLIDEGVKVNTQDKDGNTALHVAAYYGPSRDS